MSRLETALWLASRGFRVFPLIPMGKKPAINSFPVAATTDQAQLRDWFTSRGGDWMDYNIGVLTTGLVVVDIDTKKGTDVLAGYQAVGGHFDTFAVKTASGGYHCYFTGPDSSLAVNVLKGVDIRSHGGYVVGPGSVTSRVHEGCVDGEYTLVNDKALAGVPIGIAILLKPPPSQRQRVDNVERDQAVAIANATVWLQGAEPAISGQGGNSHTYRIAARVIRDFALTEETAYQLLHAHWNHRCMPPWSNDELWALVQHAENYGKGDLGTALPEQQFGNIQISEAGAIPKPYQIGIYMGNAVPLDKLRPRPWRVEKLLLNGQVSILAGMGAAGKSVFQIMMAAHWALGKDVGPFKLRVPEYPLRSVIYNAEDDTDEMSLRLAGVCQYFNFDYNTVCKNITFIDDRAGRIQVATASRDALSTYQPGVQFITQVCLDLKADVSIFDPLVSLHACEESSNKHMSFVIGVFKDIGRYCNMPVWIASHTGKGSSREEKGDADVIRGASALVWAARVAHVVSGITKEDATEFGIREREDYSRIDNAKSNMFKKTKDATAFIHWQTQTIITADGVGVPVVKDLSAQKSEQEKNIASMVFEEIIKSGIGSITRNKAVELVRLFDPFMSQLPPGSVRDMINKMFEKPVNAGKGLVIMRTVGGETLLCIE